MYKTKFKWLMVGAAVAVLGSPSNWVLAVDAGPKAEIRDALLEGCAGFVAKDLARATGLYSQRLYTFDLSPPHHSNHDKLIEANRQLIENLVGTPTCTYSDMFIKVFDKNNAYARYILSYSATLKSGAKIDLDGRGTDIFERIDGRWQVVHEHFSVPVNPITGQAQLKMAKQK
jgi:ketosteroid isomerase-like protein